MYTFSLDRIILYDAVHIIYDVYTSVIKISQPARQPDRHAEIKLVAAWESDFVDRRTQWVLMLPFLTYSASYKYWQNEKLYIIFIGWRHTRMWKVKIYYFYWMTSSILLGAYIFCWCCCLFLIFYLVIWVIIRAFCIYYISLCTLWDDTHYFYVVGI